MSEKPSAGSTRARLQLLASPARPQCTAYLPPRRLPRRPGERREPLATELSPAVLAAAAGRGVDPLCAAELCLERALVMDDLRSVGRLDVYEQLLGLAATVTVNTPLPPAIARYLRMLLAARSAAAGAPSEEPRDEHAVVSDAVIDVPLRLFARVDGVISELSRVNDSMLDEALVLEIAAVSRGRTMSEWAALSALQLSR